MRGATRAADVTNILNRKFFDFVRCLKEDLWNGKEELDVRKKFDRAGVM